jgi:hypothetical protein
LEIKKREPREEHGRLGRQNMCESPHKGEEGNVRSAD